MSKSMSSKLLFRPVNLAPIPLVLLLACTLFGGAITPVHAADSLVPDGGFENGIAGWKVFIPEESKDKNCRFEIISDSPHSGTTCVRLQSDDFARFSIGLGLLPVQAGDRYRVSVWLKADAGAQVRANAPGFVIRLGLRQGDADAEGGHLFIAPGNRVTRSIPADPASVLPKQWTQLEAVIEIPPGVDAMGPSLFSWWTSGTILADDFSIEKVDATTPLTPVWTKGAP